MNVIAITGNLCKDIEVRYTKNNKAVVENVVGVAKDKKNKETGERESDFITFVAFEKKADYLGNYAKKGDKVEVTGKLRVDSWKDEDGQYHSRTYIVADTVKILTSRPKTGFEEMSAKTEVQTQFEIKDDMLPF